MTSSNRSIMSVWYSSTSWNTGNNDSTINMITKPLLSSIETRLSDNLSLDSTDNHISLDDEGEVSDGKWPVPPNLL